MSVLVTILQAWTFIFLLLKLINHQTKGTLSRYLVSRNINLRFCFISFHTTRFNTVIETRASRHRALFSHFYSLGVLFGLLGLIASLFVLSFNAYLNLLHPLKLLSPLRAVSVQSKSSHQQSTLVDSTIAARAPSARIPFLHESEKPWWVPHAYWRRLVPKDHSAWHSQLFVPPERLSQLHHEVLQSGQKARSNAGLNNGHRYRRQGRRLVGTDLDRSSASRQFQNSRNDSQTQLWMPWEGVRVEANGDSSETVHAQRAHTGETRALAQNENTLYPIVTSDQAPIAHRQLLWERNESSTKNIRSSPYQPSHNTFFTPLVPGVTVPSGDLWYMIIAVLISAVIHELGHAFAATTQHAKLSGAGGFLALVLPGAYVRISGLEDIGLFAQLKVFCAGPWHNLVLAVLALVATAWIPVVSSVLFAIGSGALVVSVPDLSPLRGHVEPGDVILRLGRFGVKDGGASFRGAIDGLVRTNDTVGFCVPESLYQRYAKRGGRCCERKYLESLQLGASLPERCFRVEGIARRRCCIDPGVVSVLRTCRAGSECVQSEMSKRSGRMLDLRQDDNYSQGGVWKSEERSQEGNRRDEDRTSCFIPVLPRQSQLIDIRVRKASTGQTLHFFYEGYADVLMQSVTVSSYVPRFWSSLPAVLTRGLAAMDGPNMVERLLQYISSISMGLGVLNMAPVLFLDGEMSALLFVQLLLPKVSAERAGFAKRVMVWIGTVLLLINLGMSMYEIETQR